MSAKFEFASLDQAFAADWPVVVSVPLDGGATEEQRFMGRFRLLEPDEINAALTSETYEVNTLPRMYFVGFGKGETASFSADLLDRMLARPYMRLALDKAYQGFAQGVAVKN